MSPAWLLLVAYGAGLATGLTRFPDPRLVGLVVAALGWVSWHRGGSGIVWAAATGCGLAAGLLALEREAGRCESQQRAGPATLRVRLAEPVFPDQGLAAVRLPGAPCTGLLMARWPAQHLAAGSEWEVSGRWIVREGPGGRQSGTLVVRQLSARGGAPAPADRFQTWLGLRIRALFGARSGTVEALLLNRRGGMPPELRDRYARSGLVHILSISGFHVGVIVGWTVLAFRLLTPRRHVAALAGVALAVLYVAGIGWPAPAARAVLLALLLAQAEWRQRNLRPLPLLAITALLVLVLDPWALLDAGAWLSVAALGGTLLATRWSDRRLGEGWHWRMAAASVGATLATAPITAALFGTVSLAGLVLNFVAVPLAAVVIPGLIVAILSTLAVPPLGDALAAGSGAALALLDQLAWWGGGWERSVILQAAEGRSALPWIGLLAVMAWCLGDGPRGSVAIRRLLLAAAAGTWLLAGVEQVRRRGDAASGLALHFLDVGQGDAAAIRTPGGRWVLIDAGPRSRRSDAGRRVVAPFLARHGAPGLALAVISHAHADHLGGMSAVLDRMRVGNVLEPAELLADSSYLAFLDRLEAEAVPWRLARAGQAFEIDGVGFRVLHPDPAWREWRMDLNEDSAILLVEYGAFRALFAGDAGLTAEAALRGRVGTVSVLKVGHHGSRSATGDPWLAELRPRVAVISSGAGNGYGHPHQEVLARLERHRTSTWRTDQQGTITITTDGRRMRVAGAARDTIIALTAAPGAATN